MGVLDARTVGGVDRLLDLSRLSKRATSGAYLRDCSVAFLYVKYRSIITAIE